MVPRNEFVPLFFIKGLFYALLRANTYLPANHIHSQNKISQRKERMIFHTSRTMKDRLQKIRNEAIAQIKAAGGMDALNDIRVSF